MVNTTYPSTWEVQSEPSPLEKLLLVGGTLFLAAKLIDEIFSLENTVNYSLKRLGKTVYHGICYEDRLNCRLAAHERNGKIFDECVYDHPVDRETAARIERKRIRRAWPRYNVHHKW